MILVVDGHRDTCRAIQLLLTSEGFRVACASDGRAALAVIGTALPACVVVDAMTTDPPGLDVLRAILGAPGRIPVIVFTDANDPTLRRAAMTLGAADWVPKMEYLTLAAAIRKAVVPPPGARSA